MTIAFYIYNFPANRNYTYQTTNFTKGLISKMLDS